MMRLRLVTCALVCLLPAGAFAQAKGIAAECKLLELAYTQTKASGGKLWPDILSGCPGYEGWSFQMNRRDNARAMRKAMTTPVPKHAKVSKASKILFQRMISRGVPPEVAVSVSKSKQFQRAVAAFGK